MLNSSVWRVSILTTLRNERRAASRLMTRGCSTSISSYTSVLCPPLRSGTVGRRAPCCSFILKYCGVLQSHEVLLTSDLNHFRGLVNIFTI
jgi:hypothetical protein